MKYYVEGNHPYQWQIISVLEEYGYSFGTLHDSDVYIVDCNGACATLDEQDKPAILLSSSSVYSCLSSNNQVVEKPFTEDQPLVIPSTFGNRRQISWALGEYQAIDCYPNNLLLRICNPFGSESSRSFIDEAFYTLSKSNTMEIYLSEYRKKSFIYIKDLEDILSIITKFFLEGLRGVYNIGGTDIANLKSVAKSVYTHVGDKDKELELKIIETPKFRNFYEAVDITRIKALTNWEPKFSIRSGIYDYAKRLSIHS